MNSGIFLAEVPESQEQEQGIPKLRLISWGQGPVRLNEDDLYRKKFSDSTYEDWRWGGPTYATMRPSMKTRASNLTRSTWLLKFLVN